MRISTSAFRPSVSSSFLLVFVLTSSKLSFSEGVIEDFFDLVRLAVVPHSQETTIFHQNQLKFTDSQWKDKQKRAYKDLRNLALRTNEAFKHVFKTYFAEIEEIFKATGIGEANVETLNKFHEITKKAMEDIAFHDKALRGVREDSREFEQMPKIAIKLIFRSLHAGNVAFGSIRQLAEEQIPENFEQVKQILENLEIQKRKDFKELDPIYEFFPLTKEFVDEIFKKVFSGTFPAIFLFDKS